MLIKVKPSRQKPEKFDSESHYVMRRGMARVAERMKSGDPYQTTCYGQPLPHAKEMAERHSTNQIAAWGRGARRVVVEAGTTGPRRTPWPWEKR